MGLILPDSSAWIELLRGTDHPSGLRLEALIEEGGRVAVTEPVIMEVLGGLPPRILAGVRDSLVAFPMLRVQDLADYEDAVFVYRACREAGETPRQLLDCLIASVAIREGASVLHNDSDFDVIARHTTLRIEPVD